VRSKPSSVGALPLPKLDSSPADRALDYQRGVFLNCPFADSYKPIRDALIFVVLACHLRPRCALEASNFGQTRVDKIVALIRDCRWGIHDLSQIQPDAGPHFNMPLELGLFLGAHRFGGPRQRAKSCLVLVGDKDAFRQACSNVDGQDVVAHNFHPHEAIGAVRDWLKTELRDNADLLPSAAFMVDRFAAFCMELGYLCAELRLARDALTFADMCDVVSKWLILDETVATGGS
jgi:hypothetical protein